MKKRKFLKFLGFLIAVIPFCGVAYDSNSSSVSPMSRSPRYLLTGTQYGTSGDFIYYSINNDTEYAVALTESAKESTSTITIPTEYNSKPVTGIWRSGFYDSKCTGVTIPNTITVIDYEAFMESKIKTVTIPASVTDIGECAFYSCKSLTKAAIQNSTTTSETSSACSCYEEVDSGSGERSYSTLDTIPSFCFFNCIALKELVLPQSIEEIQYEAFNNCYSLFSTMAFMNIKAIRSRAFQGCKALKKVYISSSFFEKDESNQPIGIIENKAFDNCNSNLEFYLVGDSSDVNTWLGLARNANWNRKSEFVTPGSQIAPDATGSTNRYTYHITAAGASYSNDWIYTVDQNNDVEITSYIGPTEIEGEPVTFLTFPDELPSGSGNKVRSIALNALDTVKANLVRLYLPTSLKRIEADMFGSGYTHLIVIDDNTSSKCTADQAIVDEDDDLTPRIILNGLINLETIGNSAFVNMPKLTYITKLYLPYSIKAVGKNAFGGTSDNKHMQRVTDFRWDYDDEKSALKVIGREAFYKLGNSNNKGGLGSGIHNDYLTSGGNENYQLTTLVIPRTFEHFGITSNDNNNYKVGGAENNDVSHGLSAFAGCPLLKKVVFKGSKKSFVQSTPNSTDSSTFNLVITSQTFVMNGSLRTVVFEERCGRSIVFHTGAGSYQPAIGWSAGKNKNDFGGDPALQTLVLPNKYTTIRVQNYALQGNSRGVIYLTAGENNKMYGMKTTTNPQAAISNPASNQVSITASDVLEWRTIGDEGFYSNTCPGYCFANSATVPSSSVQNYFGINQKMPIYTNILYKDTISAPGVSTEVEVGIGNTIEYVENSKCAFVCNGANATMSKYLYDRHDSSFTGTATVPATVTKSGGGSCTVNAIGPSAFSAAYCDNTSYKNYSNFKDLSAVSLPNSITTIGEYAFMRAYGVTKVSSYNVSTGNSNGDYVMPSSLTSIGKHAFSFCNVVKVLNIPNSCVFYENSNNTTYETCVFSNNFSLRKITFGNNATSSTNYTTTTYTHSGDTYTSALYSTAAVSKNASSLLLVLNRDNADRLATSADLSSVPTNVGGQVVNYAEFNGHYANSYLYGAFKMCYWIDSLVVGSATNNALNQPLISGIQDVIYLNNPYNFMGKTCNLKTISFGNANTIATPSYSFEGCEQLVNIKLPRVPGATIPAGLFASIGDNVIFEVPSDNTGTNFKTCDPGVLDLTYTGYSGIEAEAFKNTGLTEVIAPITTTFTIEQDAFGGCTGLESFDLSNVSDTVTINGAFRNATVSSDLFDFGSSALIEFGEQAFKGATFSDNTFIFPAKTAEIGTSCFENCSTLYNVSAAANLTQLKRIVVDNGNNQNNAGNNTGFKQIGDYAFFHCTKLSNFDFTNFSEIERIGHYAFGMAKIANEVITPDKEGDSNTATICASGVVNLPASLTNIGVGAFHTTKVTSVTFNSSSIKFERGNSYATGTRPSSTKGGHQFRFCANLTTVWFTNPNCAWTTPYLTKSEGDQSNYFSNCKALVRVCLPRGYNLQCPKFTGSTDQTRSDSMIWDSRTGVEFWVHHTVNDLVASPAISDFFHRTASGSVAPIVFFVGTSADVSTYNSGQGKYVEIRSGAVYWTNIDGTPTYLGVATVNATTGEVTFSSGGYAANSSGVYHP